MDKETECSDVCDAVVNLLKDLGFDVFKDGSDWDRNHDKVVKILNDEVVLKKKKVTLDRVELLALLSKMLTQVVVVCNHIAGDREPNEDYVTEKLSTYPVLDFGNQDVLDRFLGILEARYGVRLQQRSWG